MLFILWRFFERVRQALQSAELQMAMLAAHFHSAPQKVDARGQS